MLRNVERIQVTGLRETKEQDRSCRLQIVLVEPRIPPNTGNIARLCAALRMPLHLVGELGFQLTDRYLKRAGLDYWEYVEVHVHPDIEEFFSTRPAKTLHFFSKASPRSYLEASYREGDCLVFGSETTGLPDQLREKYPERFVSIPMFDSRVRSLNLANAVAVAAYEAFRQTGALSRFARTK